MREIPRKNVGLTVFAVRPIICEPLELAALANGVAWVRNHAKRNSPQMVTREITVSDGLSFDAKERVKQAIDIVDLVGGYISLRRQGRNFVGLCPWHDDSRPSLQVNPERQSFKCWVCDVGGDVFSFVMKMESVDFREALQMLAERAGIEIQPERKIVGPQGSFDKRTLYKAMQWAERQYHHCLLHSPDAEPARKYVAERGISPESVEKFQLGFSPLDRDWLVKQLRQSANDADGHRAKILEAVGILIPSSMEYSGFFDRFRGRLLFTIHDSQGRSVGVGGRLLPEIDVNSQAKYVNSPETPLFSKSKLLYGLDLASAAIRKSKCALVMEGYTDVIVAHQYGFQNAVAVLGTALGAEHIRILKRYCDRVILALDGDAAGQRRTAEVLELFVAEQVDMRVLTLPDDLDPCDFLHQRGPEAFAAMLESNTVDALDFAFNVFTSGIDVDRDVNAASQALDKLIGVVSKAPRLRPGVSSVDVFREEKILQRMAAWFRVDEREVRRRLTDLRRKLATRREPYADRERSEAEPQKTAVKAPALNDIEPYQRGLWELLLQYPDGFARAKEAIRLEWLTVDACRDLFVNSLRLIEQGVSPSFERLILEYDEPTMKSLLVALDESGQAKGVGECQPEALLEELIKTFERKEQERRRPSQIAALRESGDDAARQAALLESILRQERDRQGISEPTDG